MSRRRTEEVRAKYCHLSLQAQQLTNYVDSGIRVRDIAEYLNCCPGTLYAIMRGEHRRSLVLPSLPSDPSCFPQPPPRKKSGPWLEPPPSWAPATTGDLYRWIVDERLSLKRAAALLAPHVPQDRARYGRQACGTWHIRRALAGAPHEWIAEALAAAQRVAANERKHNG